MAIQENRESGRSREIRPDTRLLPIMGVVFVAFLVIELARVSASRRGYRG
jgi:hypothetical protein